MEETRRPDLAYNLVVFSSGMMFKVYVNGALTYAHLRTKEASQTIGVNNYLQEGENLVEIAYEPFNIAEENYTPTEGMKLQVQLTRYPFMKSIDKPPYVERVYDPRTADIHLFSGQYDTKTGELAPNPDEHSVYGQGPLRRSQNGLNATDKYTLEPTKIVYTDAESGEYARKISFRFSITDSVFPTPPWIAGDVLKDTPELRFELYGAYRALYDSYKARDRDAYIKEANILFSRTALTTGYKDAATVANHIMDQEDAFWHSYDRLKPFPTREEFAKYRLEFGTQNHLVKVIPGAIRFEPEGEGSEPTYIPYVFCRPKNERLQVCDSADMLGY